MTELFMGALVVAAWAVALGVAVGVLCALILFIGLIVALFRD